MDWSDIRVGSGVPDPRQLITEEERCQTFGARGNHVTQQQGGFLNDRAVLTQRLVNRFLLRSVGSACRLVLTTDWK